MIRLRIEQPCRVDWDGMDGEGIVRFCRRCSKHVHDLSAMGQAQAHAFLAQGGDVCVRYQVDRDDRVLFVDRTKLPGARAAAAAALTLGLAAGGGCMMGKPMPGGRGCPIERSATPPEAPSGAADDPSVEGLAEAPAEASAKAPAEASAKAPAEASAKAPAEASPEARAEASAEPARPEPSSGTAATAIARDPSSARR